MSETWVPLRGHFQGDNLQGLGVTTRATRLKGCSLVKGDFLIKRGSWGIFYITIPKRSPKEWHQLLSCLASDAGGETLPDVCSSSS